MRKSRPRGRLEEALDRRILLAVVALGLGDGRLVLRVIRQTQPVVIRLHSEVVVPRMILAKLVLGFAADAVPLAGVGEHVALVLGIDEEIASHFNRCLRLVIAETNRRDPLPLAGELQERVAREHLHLA